MALAERMMAARFGAELVDHYTYVIAGDGCLQEGISHEAIDLAGHLKLRQLIVLWDDNRISIDGPTSLSTSMDQLARFTAAGWHVQAVDGHDLEAVAAGDGEGARQSDKPSLIACRTTIGKGAPNLQGSDKAHGAPLGADEIAATRASTSAGRTSRSSFRGTSCAAWRAIAARGRDRARAWEERLAALSAAGAAFEAGDCRRDCRRPSRRARLAGSARSTRQKATKVATRKASEMALEVINGATELTVGGSADLTHSNLTMTSGMARSRRATSRGATSTTAFASTAWPRR